MISDFLQIHELLYTNEIVLKIALLNDIVQNYNFHYISKNLNFKEDEMHSINQNINDSQIIIIDQNENLNQETNETYLIIGFEKTIIILDKCAISFLHELLSANSKLYICFLSNTKPIVTDSFELKNPEIKFEKDFKEEIMNLSKSFCKFKKPNQIKKIWSFIVPCISGYLIKKSYLKLNKFRIKKFIEGFESDIPASVIKKEEYVELRNVGVGSLFHLILIYHIKNEELYVIKKPFGNDSEKTKLMIREKANYMKVNHPLLPKFYGTVKDLNYIVIEFIKGQTIDNIKQMKLSYKEIINVIFEIMLIIKYFHMNKLLYRDLKPNNIMIDENKTVVLIDLDRLCENDSNEMQTLDIGGYFIDPEIKQKGYFTYGNDIYLLGKIIEYIMSQTETEIDVSKSSNINFERSKIKEIYTKCINESIENRPSISEVIGQFLSIFLLNVQIENLFAKYDDHFINFEIINKISKKYKINHDDPELQFYLGNFYEKGEYLTQNIDKAIHYYTLAADQNYPQAQFNIGLIYAKGKLIACDIKKAIHYFTLASDQNIIEANLNLGLIYEKGKHIKPDIDKALFYYELAANSNNPIAQYYFGSIYAKGEFVSRDINKAIHYFTLAADQNYPKAQFNLGLIYETGEFIKRDIEKAINYYKLAADQNLIEAQFNLGYIYASGDFVKRDIKKAIYYYLFAANQNHPQAQYNLGVIFESGKYIARDMKKAIYFFTEASFQNHPKAQFNLGVIFERGEYVKCDINKAIYFYTLSSNQNYAEAQFNLGNIFYTGKYIKRSIEKAVYYFTLASKQNHPDAQYNLGIIYEKGDYVPRDINKAIYYYTLASFQNHSNAQFNLGVIYSKGQYVDPDINKAIHYFELASKQNHPQAQYNLGLIYEKFEGEKQDINKAIHYYILASNQNIPEAQFNLGLIYAKGEFVAKDIDKVIHYFTLASNHNLAAAQFNLGIIYYLGLNVEPDIKKGRYYIIMASKNGLKDANFAHGYLFHEGKNLKRNINDAIHYYKEASSFNNQYAKNNLGVIFKNGFDDEIASNLSNAIDYFKEAIKQKNDYLSMYNLAHMYIYDERIKEDINQPIELLIKSSKQFTHSTILLCLILVKNFGFDFNVIKQKIEKISDVGSNFINTIQSMITYIKTLNSFVVNILYENYRLKDFLYNIQLKPIQTSDLQKMNTDRIMLKDPKCKNITSDFYDGFGYDLL